MDTKLDISTGNEIVDQVSRMNFSGNIIPETWYKTIVNDKGKTNVLAVLILSDIVYWYRASEKRDETTNSVSYYKKFSAPDYLQRSYDQLCHKFNISKKQARDVIVFLEELNVIKRHLRTIQTQQGPLPNVMYIELIPSVLEELTYPTEKGGIYKKIDTPLSKRKDLSSQKDAPPYPQVETNTNNTITKNTTEIETTTTERDDAVKKIKMIFSDMSVTSTDIQTIAKASNYDPDKCERIKNLLVHQNSTVKNPVGWIISGLKNDYQTPSSFSSKRNFNFQERTYTPEEWLELERNMLLKSAL